MIHFLVSKLNMTPIGKNSSRCPDTFANRCTQENKTNSLFLLHCNKMTTKRFDAKSKISASTIEMYLRIKPARLLQKSYTIHNSKTLIFPSSGDKVIRNSRCTKSSEAEGKRHTFTKIFGSVTSQAEMFEGSIKHRVAEFLGGKSSTIMTYGMRDSGKTYTLFGTSESPGIIMHGIELVFSEINCTKAPWYKPTFQRSVLCLNETARTLEMQRKTRVLNGRAVEAKRFLANLRPRNADPSADLYANPYADESINCKCESRYAMWLSFAEIYNGNVYDLLDDAEKRFPLRLYLNTEGCVCGLQKVNAITALEACQILVAGLSRMSTRSKNSESHTIFTMDLLKYQKDHAAEEVVLSTLTFCDLVGSIPFERSHMREASSINNSLLVLGRCLKALSQNQMAPFRQSKLTRICQRAFSGKENLTFIINVAFQPGLSDEIQSIFNFCDTVRKLLNHHKKCKQLCEFEETVSGLETCDDNVASSSNHESLSETAEMTGCTDAVACQNIREQNKMLKQELETVKNDMLNCEYTIRQQLADHYSHMIEELEATHKQHTKEIENEGQDLMKWSVKQIESFYKERIDNLMRHKKRKRGDSGDYIEDNYALYEALEAENAQVTSKVVALKEAVKKLRKENKMILCEKNKYSFELALVTEELKKFRQLTRARICKWGGNNKNIEDDADCLMNNLERLMDEKVKRTEKKLEEMSEHIRAMKNKDADIVSEENLSILQDLINNLFIKMDKLREEVLHKKAYVIRLQDQVQLQKRQLTELQQCLNNTKNKNVSDWKCMCDRSTNISFDDYTTDAFFQNNTPIEKDFSQKCMSSLIVEQHELNDWIIVPTSCATQNCVESTEKKLSNESNVDRKSLFDSSGNMDCSVSRSSDRSSKDSGVSSELQNESRRSTSVSDNTSTRENEDKCTEICVIDEDNRIAVEGKVEQFKIDCADSDRWNYQEALHVVELSQDLETIRGVIYALNEACVNECQLHKQGASEQLIEKESEIAIKRDLFKMIENKMQEYKHEICELIRKLAIKEENESRISECLERYIERSRTFENKLSLTRNRLDKAFNKCANEHLPKIESLEEEILQKTLQINELNGKIIKMQHEFEKGYELFQKIHDFEIIMNRCQRDKKELCRQLYECSETQLTLEDKLKKLTMKITERDSEVISLKSEVRNIADLNIANNEKARNLSEQITKAGESVDLAKEDLQYCEDLRKNVENTIKAEIHDFRSRFSNHKNNTALVNEICKTYGDSQDEITRLKMQLERKELEITLLKTNRDVTIQKYELLMRHFQNEIEEKDKHFKTVANSPDNLEGFSTDNENQRQPEETLEDHEAESSFASSSCFVPKHAISEALNVSPVPSEDFATFSDEKDGISVKLCDNESYQTDSSVKSNVRSSACETDSSETEDNFNMRPPDTKDKKKILDWMKVRRISGKTALSRLSAKHTDINSDSETE